MAIFAVIPFPNPNTHKLGGAIATLFPNSHFPLEGTSGWLIVTTGTPQELSEKLHITDGNNGAGMVVEFVSYFGRGNPNLWSWIKTNLEAKNG